MPTFETPADYYGDPADLVLARRVAGAGTVRLEPNDRQGGMPACTCHPADPDRPETSLGVCHEGDVICMTRAEAVGFFRVTSERPAVPDWPATVVWNLPRADFEYVSELDGKNPYDSRMAAQREAKRAVKAAAETEQASPASAQATAASN